MSTYQRMSRLYAPTLKEDPAEAELASHRLLLRAGMIRRTASGLYSYLPLAWRSLRKIEEVIREEMEAIGAQESYEQEQQQAAADAAYQEYLNQQAAAHSEQRFDWV